jgi:hypothetical protein
MRDLFALPDGLSACRAHSVFNSQCGGGSCGDFVIQKDQTLYSQSWMSENTCHDAIPRDGLSAFRSCLTINLPVKVGSYRYHVTLEALGA